MPAAPLSRSRARVRRALIPLVLLLLVAGFPLAARTGFAAERPNGAGLVIRHGDGRLLYVHVEFTEPEITGMDLLMRSGLALVTASYGGLGEAVCSLDSEGCPAENCFCESYGNSSYYWHYYRLNPDGTWSPLPVGPSSRKIRDGDVDGWSWTAGDGNLPPTSIDEIARLNGVDRSAAAPTPTPVPSPTPTPTPVPTPTPTSTPSPPPPTSPPASVAEPTPTPTATVTPAPTATVVQPTPTPAQAIPSPTFTATTEPQEVEMVPGQTPDPTVRAVEVDAVTGSSRPIDLSSAESDDRQSPMSYVGFGALLLTIVGVTGWALIRQHREGGP